jgi:hypothetical protein
MWKLRAVGITAGLKTPRGFSTTGFKLGRRLGFSTSWSLKLFKTPVVQGLNSAA